MGKKLEGFLSGFKHELRTKGHSLPGLAALVAGGAAIAGAANLYSSHQDKKFKKTMEDLPDEWSHGDDEFGRDQKKIDSALLGAGWNIPGPEGNHRRRAYKGKKVIYTDVMQHSPVDVMAWAGLKGDGHKFETNKAD